MTRSIDLRFDAQQNKLIDTASPSIDSTTYEVGDYPNIRVEVEEYEGKLKLPNWTVKFIRNIAAEPREVIGEEYVADLQEAVEVAEERLS